MYKFNGVYAMIKETEKPLCNSKDTEAKVSANTFEITCNKCKKLLAMAMGTGK